MDRNKPVFKVMDEDGNEVELPAKFIVCPRCEGKGVHDHPAFSNGLTQEDFDDQDFKEEYFRGTYDVACTECKGERVVPAPIEDKLNEQQKKFLEAHYEMLSEKRAEQRMRDRGIEF
jgi:uncharacterized protein YrzB (UPF0473 family)